MGVTHSVRGKPCEIRSGLVRLSVRPSVMGACWSGSDEPEEVEGEGKACKYVFEPP